jgi:hypothetical protein
MIWFFVSIAFSLIAWGIVTAHEKKIGKVGVRV